MYRAADSFYEPICILALQLVQKPNIYFNMKKAIFTLSLIFVAGILFSQKSDKVPSVKLKNLEGKTIDTSTLDNDGKPMVICFWATWCSPCKRELNTYQELYEEWQDETGLKIVAVTIDDQRSVSRVGPYVNSVEWDFDILLDPNKDFARAMNVINVPHTFLIDGNGNIVWQHNNYATGDEEELIEQVRKLVE